MGTGAGRCAAERQPITGGWAQLAWWLRLNLLDEARLALTQTVWDHYTATLAPSNWGTTRISWYAWTPPVSGSVTIRTQMLQAWDSNMQVFNAAGSLIAENDDFPDEAAPCTYATNCTYNSQVSFNFEADQTYRIGLGGFFGKTGSAKIYFTFS